MVKLEQLEQAQLTTLEYKRMSMRHNTYNIPQRRAVNHGNPPPNWRMGESLSPGEMKIANDRIDEALKDVKCTT